MGEKIGGEECLLQEKEGEKRPMPAWAGGLTGSADPFFSKTLSGKR